MDSHACPKTHTREPGEATGSVLCAPCVRRLEGNLRTLPGLYQESLHHISPVSRRMHQTRVSGSRSRDQLNLSALDARHNILTILESWSDFAADELGKAVPTRSVPHLADFLLINLEWLTAQPPAADFAEEIDGLRQELLRTIDPDSSELPVFTWDCVVDSCTGTIDTSPKQIGNTDRRSIRCSSGHSWEMHEWITLRPLMERQRKTVHA